MVYCSQETGNLGSGSILVQGYIVLWHNQEERTIGAKGRIPGGVAIILSPTAVEAWRAAGSKPPITTPLDSSFFGRFIGVKLRYPQINQSEKKVRGNLNLFIASIYHPVDEFKHTEFIDILSAIMSSVKKSSKFIGGHDVNANLVVRSKIYGKTLGPRGINNCNMKGRRILGFFSNNQLKVANSFYKKFFLRNMDILQQDEVTSHARRHFGIWKILQMCKELWHIKNGNEKWSFSCTTRIHEPVD